MDPTTTLLQEWGATGAVIILMGGVIAYLFKFGMGQSEKRIEELKQSNERLLTALSQSTEAARAQVSATNSLAEVVKSSLNTRGRS